jgi:hypothetical protein
MFQVHNHSSFKIDPVVPIDPVRSVRYADLSGCIAADRANEEVTSFKNQNNS